MSQPQRGSDPINSDQPDLACCCDLVSRCAISSGWKHLVYVLAEIEARRNLPPRKPAASVGIEPPAKDGTT
jgi:hypothetical protein